MHSVEMKMLKSTLHALWLLFVFLKIKWLITAIFYADSPLRAVKIESFSCLMGNQTQFPILDRPEVEYTQVPILNQRYPEFVLMVLTAPSNVQQRAAIRQHASKIKGTVIFRKISPHLKVFF